MQEMLFEIPEKVRVSGVVHFEGQPIEGATVYAHSCASNGEDIQTEETPTYRDGSFVFESLLNVPHRMLIASKPGWAFGWTFIKGTENTEDAAIELHEALSFCGTVLNTEGEPIQGACVRTYFVVLPGDPKDNLGTGPEAKVGKAMTDFCGNFCLSDVPKGAKLSIEITHPDYSKSCYGGLIAGGKDFNFELAGFSAKFRRKSPGGTIEGRLLFGTTGEPATGITLAAICDDNGSRFHGHTLAKAKADENGFFCLENLIPGLYYICLSSKLDSWTTVPEEVLVDEGQTVSGLELKLIKGGRITGRLTDADTGEPFVDKWVWFKDSPRRISPPGAIVRTDENGVYRFLVPPGRITIYHSPPSGYNREAIKRHVDVAEGETINVDFSLHRKKSKCVVIALMTPDGKPVPGAQIYRERRGGPPSRADDEGCFTLEWKHRRREESLFIIQPKLRLCGTAKVQLQREGEYQIKLEPYQVAGEVKGRVVDENGEPVAGAYISADFWDDDALVSYDYDGIIGAGAMSDKHGEFRLSNLIVGRSHNLSIEGRKGYGDAHRSFVPTVETFRLPEIVLLTADRHIAGRVTTPDGTPLPGVRVFNSSGPLREASTDAKGRYRLTELTKERVHVVVKYARYLLVHREVIPNEDAARNEVERRKSEGKAYTLGLSDFVIETGDQFVSGKIIDIEGQPIGNAGIRVEKGETLYSTQSDDNGHYYLPDLVDETIELVVSHPDYSDVCRTTETNKSDVDFVLTPI